MTLCPPNVWNCCLSHSGLVREFSSHLQWYFKLTPFQGNESVGHTSMARSSYINFQKYQLPITVNSQDHPQVTQINQTNLPLSSKNITDWRHHTHSIPSAFSIILQERFGCIAVCFCHSHPIIIQTILSQEISLWIHTCFRDSDAPVCWYNWYKCMKSPKVLSKSPSLMKLGYVLLNVICWGWNLEHYGIVIDRVRGNMRRERHSLMWFSLSPYLGGGGAVITSESCFNLLCY